MVKKRWSDDERGRGVASAKDDTPAVESLLRAMREPDWVTEDPQAHLPPRIEAISPWPMRVVETSTTDGGELVVATGRLDGQSHLAPHGHTVRLILERSG